ncbi:MAG: F0F1 ATP synthase subunit A [Paramuribaculum sp.]|nr:F0F1 ATP synthase subunit A [Paramuribaculum sp.]MDE6489429.1 F0F1 ATP synthase subunit A [Paramuribaculum sp.]
MKKIAVIVTFIFVSLFIPLISVAATTADGTEIEFTPKEIIFEHLGDGYGWEVPFDHHHRIPLPVILFGEDGFHCFMSSKVTDGEPYRDGDATFIIPKDGQYKGKVVQLMADGSQYRPWDISITKNVCELFIACLLVMWSVFAVGRWHRREMYKAPRKIRGIIETLIVFVYDGVIRPTLGDRSKKFGPFLLTVFFFILYLNLLGLMVVFPGGANLTGNIAVTLVLSIFTFLVTNIFGTKHYWKEIFWPDVPLWLKFPIPIMPIIELFGVFTKPAALTIRLFANMMGGHMIVIVLTLFIFIFAAFGPAVTGVTTVFSVLFSLFMLLIDVLVSFIQAYVFTMLSTMFISFGTERGHDSDHQSAHETSKQIA